MIRLKFIIPALLVGAAFVGAPAQAALLGSQANGSIKFGANPLNYYLPANGGVPAGYGNTTGQPVTIANPIIEFGYDDAANLDSANFTATQLIIRDLVKLGAANWVQTFTLVGPNAFTALSLVSSNFQPGLTFSLAAGTITVNWAGTSGPGDYTATFNVDANAPAVPEPASWAMMIGGFGLVGGAMRRRTTTVRYA